MVAWLCCSSHNGRPETDKKGMARKEENEKKKMKKERPHSVFSVPFFDNCAYIKIGFDGVWCSIQRGQRKQWVKKTTIAWSGPCVALLKQRTAKKIEQKANRRQPRALEMTHAMTGAKFCLNVCLSASLMVHLRRHYSTLLYSTVPVS